MKKLLSVILSITMLLSMATVAFADVTAVSSGAREVEGIIKVGTCADFAPFEYMENDKLAGFDIDLMNYIAARIGYGVEFVDMPFDELIPSVVNGEVDCAISSISVTKERNEIIDYSNEYLRTSTITFENGQKKTHFGETYAIVFRNGLADSPYKSTTPTEAEALYIMVNNALRDLSKDGTVTKLIEKYELNKPLDESIVNIKYSVVMGCGTPPAKVSETIFPLSEWASNDIVYAHTAGITENGKNYLYKENITREEFCELIYNLIILANNEITAPVTDGFADTDNDKILMLNGLGIINGKSETEFAPNDYLTREEAATIVIRMVNKVFPMAATEMWVEYDDIDEISEWASEPVQIISNLGFMKGVGDKKFAPKDTYTTEQAIVTLVRVFERAKSDESTSIGVIGGADGPTQIIVSE